MYPPRYMKGEDHVQIHNLAAHAQTQAPRAKTHPRAAQTRASKELLEKQESRTQGQAKKVTDEEKAIHIGEWHRLSAAPTKE